MIRLLNENDATNYRKLRLTSLKTNPLSFLSTYEVESKYTPLYFKRKIINSTKAPIYGIYGYFLKNKLIAYAQLTDSFYYNKRHIINLNEIYVHPNHRQKQVATKLVKYAIKRAKEDNNLEQIILRVNSQNKNAISLYEKIGFKKEAVLKDAVKNPDNTYQDEYFYRLNLKI